jgi:hypothetical protein
MRTAAPSSSNTSGPSNENVINQGLFYLDWLLDHKADFKLLVLERYGPDAAASITWSGLGCSA